MTPAQETSERELLALAENLDAWASLTDQGFKVFSSTQSLRDAATALRLAALRAAGDAPAWQPISTAPRTGARILVVYGGQTRVAQWGKTSHVPLYGFCLADQGPEDFDLVEVSLWQPLPRPERGAESSAPESGERGGAA